MRIALIGAGRIGRAHGASLSALDDVTEVLVADADGDRARLLADECDQARAVSVDEAWDGSADAVVIAAPTTVHAASIRRAVAAGIPAFCEKPLAPSLTETVAVVREVEGSGVPVQVGFQRRFDPGYRAARKALDRGDLGALRRVHLMTCDPAPPPVAFIAHSGGIYRDCHIHDFDILRWVTGRQVQSVMAFGANRGDAAFVEADDVDESVAILTMTDGTMVTMQGSRYNGAGYDVRMELAGTTGTYAVGLDERTPVVSAEPGVSFPSGRPWRNFTERFADAYRAELEDFLHVARGERNNPCTPREAAEALWIAEAADLSRRTARPVTIAEIKERMDGIERAGGSEGVGDMEGVRWAG